MKRFISVVLCAAFVLGTAPFAFAAAPEDFVPVIRFVAASDTHVKEDDNTNALRIPKMMDLAYGIADSDPAYGALDAVLIAGDLTDRGTKPAFDIFWDAVSSSLREGTRFLGVVAKNHDGYEMKRSELRDYYSNLTGNEPDFNVEIGGYHFIGLSASPVDGVHYTASQQAWLRQQLDAAVKEDPDKPVFFMNHEPALNTVYGSSVFDLWGIPTFNALLNRYPQVVHFAGHSHYPLNDPRSVWQGKFTEIGTGAIYYSEFTIDNDRAYDPPDCRQTVTCWIAELDADNNMRLRGYDVNEAKQLCEVYLENPADPQNREHTPEKMKAAARAPEFAEGAQLSAEPSFGACTVTAPVADSLDGQPVTLYRASAKDRFGLTLSRTWTLPTYYRAIEQNEIKLSLEGLVDGEYTITVTAENAYGKRSEPLEIKVSVPGETGIKAVFARIKYVFEWLINHIKQLA